ncbi:MAG TPA: hypothetical protein VMB78_11495 [Dissulfurispiraceae bacterium]|nr:hypothetical protein [Dissulfurispiraceae bacterium]
MIYMLFAGALAVCLLCGACALNSSYLRTELADKSEIKGTCSVVLYGANYIDDIATVALIIPEGGQYTFDIFAPDFNYRTIKGVPAADAVKMAEKFVVRHPDFQGSQTSRILDVNGRVIGYEVRPLYRSTTFGTSDVMYVDYFLEDTNKVVVHIHLNIDVERKFMGGSDGHDSNR